MFHDILKIRIRKLLFIITNPFCWRAFTYGVAPAIEHIDVLRTLSVDGIIDVGANRGQFTLVSCMALPNTNVIAFEPIPTEASLFRKIHRNNHSIRLVESALGETTGLAKLHLSKRADSSSLLPIGRRQIEIHKNTAEAGTIEVSVSRLDDLEEYWQLKKQLLMKLDVQGFELFVLKGSSEALKHCAYVYAECSEVSLYHGQALRPEVEAYLKDKGFFLKSRHNEQWDHGELIQADYLFVKS